MAQVNVRRKVGLRVKALREARGINQNELAYALGMSRSYLAKIETGSSNVTVEATERLADGLGVPLSTFFDDELFTHMGPNASRIAHAEPLDKKRASASTLLDAPNIEGAVLAAMRRNPHVTVSELAQEARCGDSRIERIIARLKESGAIERVGSPRAGHWQVQAANDQQR